MKLIELLDVIAKNPAGNHETFVSFFSFGGKPESNRPVTITTGDMDFYHLCKVVRNNPILASKIVCWVNIHDSRWVEIALPTNYGDPFYEREKAREGELLKNASIH